MENTKEKILGKMFEEMPYQMRGKEQILPYIKEAMEIYANDQTTQLREDHKRLRKGLKSAFNTISRLRRSMSAHPDCEEGSEFEDYVSLAKQEEYTIEQLIEGTTASR